MLEKQKKWCKETGEKGKEWIKRNKFAIGFATGCVGAVVGAMVLDKIFENRQAGISFGHITNKDGSWSDDFGVETYGIDRFGNVKRGHRVRMPQSDADWIAEHAHKVVADINEHNKK